MLKSSLALDGFHSILKMKRRVAGGGGGGVRRGVTLEREGGMREPFGEEEGKTKRENRSNTSSTLQHCHNTRTNLQFIPWEKKSGNGEGERGGGEREGEGNWSDFVSEREEKKRRRRWEVSLIRMGEACKPGGL